MGSQSIQSQLWGQRPGDWATIQEPTVKPCYQYALDLIRLKPTDTLLDVGCGTGYFISLAAPSGADITGFDATAPFIEAAKQRNPGVTFLTGEMEELPFADNSFDFVTGFNSFQYAADVSNALKEARRVLKPQGKLIALIWGEKEDCEAASYLRAVGSLLPPPPPGAPGPFALTEHHLLETILQNTGFKILKSIDLDSPWDYPDTETAIKGLLSAGPAAKAIENAGYEKAYHAISAALHPYIKSNGHVLFANKFRMVMAEK